MIFVVMGAGALVFIASYFEGIPLLQWILNGLPGIIAIIMASISLGIMFYLLNKNKPLILRLLAGFQVTMILFAATYSHFPDIVLLKGGSNLSLLTHQGQLKTMETLGYALLIGSVFILPALFYLIYSFQKKPDIPNEH